MKASVVLAVLFCSLLLAACGNEVVPTQPPLATATSLQSSPAITASPTAAATNTSLPTNTPPAPTATKPPVQTVTATRAVSATATSAVSALSVISGTQTRYEGFGVAAILPGAHWLNPYALNFAADVHGAFVVDQAASNAFIVERTPNKAARGDIPAFVNSITKINGSTILGTTDDQFLGFPGKRVEVLVAVSSAAQFHLIIYVFDNGSYLYVIGAGVNSTTWEQNGLSQVKQILDTVTFVPETGAAPPLTPTP